MDFQKLIEQFKDTEGLKFLREVRSWQLTPDELFYEIETNDGIYYVFEIDYIGDFNFYVVKTITDEIGGFTKMFEVKSPLVFDEAEPVRHATIYIKPPNWEDQWKVTSKYANEKYGSATYYFNFLVKK
ncbi:MAG: hypothetical protein JNK26_00555 [Candidatus Doudnabacteria bacterium]|nr:hypothetical protein [Candidatus Doudnabacteria bacterium]